MLQETPVTAGGQQRVGCVRLGQKKAGGHQAGWHGEMDDTHCQWAQPKEISNPGARPLSLRVGTVPLQPAHSC